MKGDASNIYKWVVDDVVAAMAPEFQAANVDESVLNELKQKWEEKLKQQGLIRDDHDVGDDLLMAQMQRGGVAADDGGDDDDDDEPGAAGSLLGKRKQPENVALPHVLAAHNPALQAAQQYFAAFTQHLQAQTLQFQQQQQLQLQQQLLLKQQQEQANQQQRQQQQTLQHPHAAHAAQAQQPQLAPMAHQQHQQHQQQQPQQQHISYYPQGGVIPQRDGDGDDGAGDGAGQSAGAAGPSGSGAAGAEGEAPPEGDEVLSEDDHDDNEEEEVVENLMIGQFEKVNKMKSRWKVAMRDCVFHINGRDFLFKKCTAEFSWQ